jgi:Hint module
MSRQPSLSVRHVRIDRIPHLTSTVVVNLALILTVNCILATAAHASLSPNQITGLYTLVPLSSTTTCPSSLRVRKAEYDTSQSTPRYVIAHSNIFFTPSPSAPQAPLSPCLSAPVSSVAGITLSSTILRRSDQVRVSLAPELLSAFYANPADTFFVGYEVSPRFCGTHALPDAQLSLWALPTTPVTARYGNVDITFRAGVKQIFYFISTDPCLYEGNAADLGVAATAPPTTTIPPTTPTTASLPTGASGPAAATGSVTTALSPTTTSRRRTAYDNPECFPGSAMFMVHPGVPRRISSLRIGDLVQVAIDPLSAAPIFEPIFAFSHASKSARPAAPLVRIWSASNASLTVTAGHLLPVRKCRSTAVLVAAIDVLANGCNAVYDARAGGMWSIVTRIDSIDPSDVYGLYNPHTAAGTVVVDGVLASCFTTAIQPRVAALLLLPARWAFALRRTIPVPENRCDSLDSSRYIEGGCDGCEGGCDSCARGSRFMCGFGNLPTFLGSLDVLVGNVRRDVIDLLVPAATH